MRRRQQISRTKDVLANEEVIVNAVFYCQINVVSLFFCRSYMYHLVLLISHSLRSLFDVTLVKSNDIPSIRFVSTIHEYATDHLLGSKYVSFFTFSIWLHKKAVHQDKLTWGRPKAKRSLTLWEPFCTHSPLWGSLSITCANLYKIKQPLYGNK